MTDQKAFDLANDYHDCEICGRKDIVSLKAMRDEKTSSVSPGLCAPCIALVPAAERDYLKREELREKIRARIAEKTLAEERPLWVWANGGMVATGHARMVLVPKKHSTEV